MRASGALALLLLLTASARAHDLGRLEREALDDALQLRQLTIDPAPEGKTIGQVQVVTLEVFSKRDWSFQFFNIFHRTTREGIIRREALFAAGQPYREALIEETWRNLQNPDLSSAVVIVPVKNPAPGMVDVLIVSRDVWSLRLNTDFEVQGSGFPLASSKNLLALSTSLSENNLFGWRKQAAFVLDMDQGRIALGPTYIDRNVAGTRLTLTSSVRALFAREDFRSEGSSSSTVLRYPLYSLASKWGAVVSVGHSNGVVRRFLGDTLRPVDFTETPAKERFPWIYRLKTFNTGAGVTRSFGTAVIQRVGGGYAYSVVRPFFTPDFPDDPVAKEEFARQIFPPSERISDVYVSYGLFTPRYRTYRDLDTFDLSEVRTLGPSASSTVARGAQFLGGDRDFYSVSGSGGWVFDLAGGLQSVSAGWSGRIEGGRLRDQNYTAGIYAASPVLVRKLRVIGSLGASSLVDDTRNSYYSLGGENGLRGYAVGDLFGKAQFLGHLEARTMAIAVASLRLGAVAYYDVGDAGSPDPGTGADLVRALRQVVNLQPKSDLGAGLRLLIPQLNNYVLRLDCAFPLQSTTHTQAGRPRFSFGFSQVF
jgi:hypothetical protein